jgi:ethanolamine ammonia-lyase large subunit
VLLTLLATAGCNFIMGVPGSDDIMLNYQTTSFHDALYARRVLKLRPAPEFEAWLHKMAIFRDGEQVQLNDDLPPLFSDALLRLVSTE